MKRSFLHLLTVVSLMTLGLLYLLTTLFNYLSRGYADIELLSVAAIGLGLVISAYGMFYGKKFGWILALIFIAIDAFMNIYYNIYIALVVDAVLVILLILVGREFGFTLFTKKPSTPVPPPSKPLSIAYKHVIEHERKFVRRKK